jgi:ferredoxin
MVRRVVGRTELNPVYHAGTITIWLLGIVVVTGLYLTMFFRFGFDASYEAVAEMEANAVGRFMRAAHRYASIGAVVMAAVHGWRTFVVRRFDGPRRVPWATGVAMVAVLWVIGVTGYWLIWDERSQVLNEALVRVGGGTAAGLDFLIDHVLTDAAGTGWPFVLMLLTVHVGLSVAVVGLLWWHLRRLSRRHWVPPASWRWIVGATIALVSIAVPVGMLGPVDRHAIPGSMPFDPFFLFLLPGTLAWPPALFWGVLTLLLVAVVFLPWYLRARRLTPVDIDEERCIGCTYCVADCPYGALEMVPRDVGPHPLLAMVSDDRCVSCGICIGSCPTEAMTLGDAPAAPLWRDVAVAGRDVVLVCERHAEHGASMAAWDERPGNPVVIPLPCAGMAGPKLLTHATDGGAESVVVVGCPADDCANLEGNRWLQERLDRTRRPRLRSSHVGAPISTAWETPDTPLASVLAAAPQHPAPPTLRDREIDWTPTQWVRTGALTLAVGLLTVVATLVPLDPGGNDEARIEIIIDHADGTPLLSDRESAVPADGRPSRVIATVDGATLLDTTVPFREADNPQTSLGLERIPVPPGTHDVYIALDDGAEPVTLFDDVVALDEGEVLTVDILDAPITAPEEVGRSLFFETTLGTNTGCRICHSLDEGEVIVGPSLARIGRDAATRVPGLSAEDYIRQSIVDPDAHVVPGFPEGQMVPTYLDILTDDDIEGLVAYLLTLE